CRFAERVDLAYPGKLPERARLDALDVIAGHAEPPDHLLDGGRVGIPVEPVAQLYDRALRVRELGHGTAHRLLTKAHLDRLGYAGLVALEQFPQGGVLFLLHGTIEARQYARGLAHLVHLPERDLRALRDLLVGRGPLELDR